MQNCSFLYNAATMPCFTHVCLVAIALALIIEFPLYGGGELPLREVSIMKQETGNTTCPPWFIPVCDNHDCNCTCGRSLQGIVDCSSSTQQIFLSDCYCMTVDRQVQTSIAVVGSCPYTCIVGSRWYSTPEELNNKTCGLNWNRRGQLCSQCQEGHSPAIYSYFLQCVPCTSWMTKDVIMVLSVSFLPLTFFCFVIIFFRVSAARPPLSTFILVSQMMAAPQYMQYKFAPHNVYQSRYIFYHVKKSIHNTCWNVYATFFGIWNLDFFRSLYPSMCLTPHMTTLQAVFLEYCIGLYPLAVLAFTCVLVKMYDCSCGAGLCDCRLFYSCLTYLRRKCDIRSSLIDAFATFLILSYIKIGYTTLQILKPTIVYKLDGTYKLFVFVDPSYEYFQNYHLLYALPAICIALAINIFPLLLLFLYPMSCFQKCLNCCHMRCMLLRTFADAFQGCYKDGTDGTRDYRWFSAAHLIMRFCIIVAFDVTRYFFGSYPIPVLLSLLYVVFTAMLQPYKENKYFLIDMVLFLGFSMWTLSLNMFTGNGAANNIRLIMLASSCLIQFFYFCCLILHWIFVEKEWHKKIYYSLRYLEQHIDLRLLQ